MIYDFLAMKLHVFNPEHDLALASGIANFTAPHAGRALRADLGFIPALWADDGDAILVENQAEAQRKYHRLIGVAKKERRDVQFVTKHDLQKLSLTGVEPWGWDLALRSQLLRYGVDEGLLPTVDGIGIIRELSHRRYAAMLLDETDVLGTVGEACCCSSADEIEEKLQLNPCTVLKAPWSSSGRGVRFVESELTPSLRGWMTNIIRTQGGVMVEPYYPKVKDFAMEFYSDGQGNVSYLGLSLFHTVNGAYTGNILAHEEVKREMIIRYVSTDTLQQVQERIKVLTGAMYKGRYKGPFGIDMMVVKGEETERNLLHPCVEINLRRTMGMVAHYLTSPDPTVRRLMRVTLEGRYKLRTRKLI